MLASRLRGGARSTKSSKKGSSSSASSQSSSVDEINAFADDTVRLAYPPRNSTVARVAAPSPSSNLPTASLPSAPVFSRPGLSDAAAGTEDIPTATPSRAPSRAASIASTGDAGIAELLQPDPFTQPSEPPSFSDVVGRIHRRYPLASLKVDDEDTCHFLARDNTRVEDIAHETEYLLSSTTSWPSILYFLRDTMKFDAIRGSVTEFQVVLAGLAEIWSDAADIDAREVLHNMVEAV